MARGTPRIVELYFSCRISAKEFARARAPGRARSFPCRVASPRGFSSVAKLSAEGIKRPPMSDARVARGSAPAHEIRDCILRRATKVNGFGRGRSCRGGSRIRGS